MGSSTGLEHSEIRESGVLPENKTDWARILETDKLSASREGAWMG